MALVGVGRWGKNLLRVLNELCDVAYCCNKSDIDAQGWVNQRYPHIECTFDYQEVLSNSSIDALIIATPINTHGSLARQALEADKHVFVEKPLSMSSAEATELVGSASERGLRLFVGHLFLFHPVLRRIKEATRSDPVDHARMSWAKFGTFKEDIF